MVRGPINEDIRRNLKKIAEDPKRSSDLDNVVSEVLTDSDLFLYMAVHSKEDRGLIVGRMDYFDDIDVHIPYGIAYNFNKNDLDIFTFEFIPSSVAEQIPSKTLERHKTLPRRKSMGVGTYEDYSDYPTPEKFLKSLDNLFQYGEDRRKNFWVDFNEPFYR